MPATVPGWLRRLAPSWGETWTFAFGSLIPFLMLGLMRAFIAHSLQSNLDPWEYLRIQDGDWEFWVWWGWGWWLGFKLVGRFLRLPYRLLFHGLTAFLTLLCGLDLIFFQVTGGRADWDVILYGLSDLRRVWPVVSSELTAPRWAALATVLAVAAAPLFRRWPQGAARFSLVAWLLCFGPVIWMESTGRSKPDADVAGLQKGMVEALFWEGLDRLGDTVIEPDPAELVQLDVAARPDARRPNVVVVMLESVRAAATTPYAPDLQTTPNLAKLATEGLQVDDMYAVVPHTSKAIVTSMCGDWPYLYVDIREARPGGLPGRCLPELMEELGYRTAFFQPAREDFEDRVDLVHNLGFQLFRPKQLIDAPGIQKTNYFGIDDRAMIDPGLDWATKDPSQPFFQVYLTLASHHDYKVPAHWQTKTWPDTPGRLGEYYAAVHYVDDFLGRLVEEYRQRGLLDNTVFLIYGDHGEGFGEHGRNQHDLVIYEEGLHIPMVLWGPDVLQRTGHITGKRQQIDILPTILELVGADVTRGTPRGKSLLGEPDPARVLYHSCWRAHECLARREGDDKFIDLYRAGGRQVFDLVKDPGELHNLASKTASDTIDTLQADAREWRSRIIGRYQARIAEWKAAAQVPDTREPVATWDGKISLMDCAIEQAEVMPGEAVWANCRWRAETKVDEALRITGKIEAGRSKTEEQWSPGDGELPVWEWTPGDAVHDYVRIHVPTAAPPGKATMSLAWEHYTGTDLELAPGVTWQKIGTVTVLPRRKAVHWTGSDGLLPGAKPTAAVPDPDDPDAEPPKKHRDDL